MHDRTIYVGKTHSGKRVLLQDALLRTILEYNSTHLPSPGDKEKGLLVVFVFDSKEKKR